MQNVNDSLKDIMLKLKHWRVVRVDVRSDDLTDTLKWLDSFEHYVIGIERNPKLHIHIVIGHSTNEFGSQNNILKTKVRNLFDVEGSQFSTSSVHTSIRKAIMYSIKDLEFKYKGFSSQFIEAVKLQSTHKFNSKEYMEKWEKIVQSYFEDKIDVHQFSLAFTELKIQYGQKPNPRSEDMEFLRVLLKKDAEYRSIYSDHRVTRVFQYISYQ